MTLSPKDHDELEQAAELVQAVMDRHHLDIDMRVLSFLMEAMQSIRMGEKYLGGAA